MDSTALAGALKWKWAADTCDYYFDAQGALNVYNWKGPDAQPTVAEIEQAVSDFKASNDYLVPKFDAEVAIGREAQVFTGAELIRLMPYSYTLNELIRFKNFWGGVSDGNPYVGLKQVGEGLVAGGQILQSDYDKLAGVLAEQGIIL